MLSRVSGNVKDLLKPSFLSLELPRYPNKSRKNRNSMFGHVVFLVSPYLGDDSYQSLTIWNAAFIYCNNMNLAFQSCQFNYMNPIDSLKQKRNGDFTNFQFSSRNAYQYLEQSVKSIFQYSPSRLKESLLASSSHAIRNPARRPQGGREDSMSTKPEPTGWPTACGGRLVCPI